MSDELTFQEMGAASHRGRKPKKKKKFTYRSDCYNPKEDLPDYIKVFNTTNGQNYKGR